MDKSNLVFRSVLVREKNGFTALCIDTDVASEGGTPEEAKAHLREAVELYVESAVENNLPVIRPVPRAENPLLTCEKDIVDDFVLNLSFRVTAHV